MPGLRLTAWLRPLLTLVALLGVLSLAACGGGNGAPNNPFQGGAGPLVITPSVANTYSGNPFVFTVTGGQAPYTVISSDQAIIPIAGTLDGNVLVVTPNTVGADTAVTLTVRDAKNSTVTANVTVKPSLLLPESITITGNPNCADSGADLCSGQDGTATVKVTGPGGAPLADRPVRFDVVQGSFSLSSTAAGQPLVQSLTVNTDQNGNATVRIVVPVNAATQVASIRATDVTTGSSIVGQFTIAQFVNGSSVLTVIPTGLTTFTGPDTQTCNSGTSAVFYVFGGTPPYTIATTFPQGMSISGSPVQRSGGGFTVTTNGTCFTNQSLTITDATGRTVITPPTVSNVFGTAAPPPATLAINPSSATCTAGSTNNFDFLITGGTGTFNAITSPVLATPVTVTSGTAHVTISASEATSGAKFVLTVSSGSQLKSVTITCQ